MALLWLEFIGCSLLILVSGAQLLKYGDQISRLSGLGGTWIGLILLATVTSLPELASGMTAVTAAGAPNLAVGDVLGSCVFNLALIAVLDALQRPASVFEHRSASHQLGAAFGIGALSVVGMALLSRRWPGLTLFPSTYVAPILVLLYLVAVRAIFIHERGAEASQGSHGPRDRVALRTAVVRYGMAALVVVAAAIALPFVGHDLAVEMRWTDGFVGTLLMAASTSLPEFAVTAAAVRRGAIDMAIGNLLGSNLFNMVVLSIDSLLFAGGPLLETVAPTHIASVFAAVAMSGALMVALIAPPRARLVNTVSATSVLLLALFFANAWIHLRHPGA